MYMIVGFIFNSGGGGGRLWEYGLIRISMVIKNDIHVQLYENVMNVIRGVHNSFII